MLLPDASARRKGVCSSAGAPWPLRARRAACTARRCSVGCALVSGDAMPIDGDGGSRTLGLDMGVDASGASPPGAPSSSLVSAAGATGASSTRKAADCGT